MEPKLDAQLTFRLTADLKARLETVAKAQKRTAGYLCNEYVGECVARDEKNIKRRRGPRKKKTEPAPVPPPPDYKRDTIPKPI